MNRRTVDRVRHALLRGAIAIRHERGQGTVEYVALILLIASVMTAVVLTTGLPAGNIAKTIVKKLQDSIDNVGIKH
jgi:hypothetical protein